MSDQLFPGSPGDMLDTVEKLRAEIEQLREELDVNRTALEMKHAEIERLRAANAKAVEALKQISETGTQLGTRYRMASIARATLKEIGGDNG